MGKKSGPPAPDYAGAAQQQGQANERVNAQQTWANRPTLNTPWGSQTWEAGQTIDPATGQPVTSWTSNIRLDPRQQRALDDQMAINETRSSGAQSLANQAVQNFQRPMDWNNLPSAYNFGGPAGMNMDGPQVQSAQTGVNTQPLNLGASQFQDQQTLQGQFRMANTPQASGQVADAGQIQQGVGQVPGAQRQLGDAGPVAREFGGAPMDFANQAMEAVWAGQRPQLEQRRQGTESQLANMGLTRGSEAWNREMERLDSSENSARLQAYQTGANIQNQMFGQAMNQGQFANQAQNQAFQQSLAGGQFNNQGMQQDFNNQVAAGQFGNQAQNQQFQQNMAQAQFGNQAQGQNFNQAQQMAQFGQNYGRDMFDRSMGQNNQQFNQGMQNAQLYNQAGQQLFNQDLARMGFENQGRTQQMNNQMAYGGYQNQLRQQAIAEQMQQRNQTLNELNSLLSGQQIGMPQMPNFSNAQRAEAAPIFQGAQMQNQAQQQAFQNQQMGLGQLGQLMGTAGSMFMFSDVRLKSDIVPRAATTPRGFPLYEYTIFGRRETGVLAHEVAETHPELVTEGPQGFLMVDYAGV
jgi:hypothetical protein